MADTCGVSLKISAQSPSNVLPGLALAAAGVAVAYLVAAPFSVLSPMAVSYTHLTLPTIYSV